MRNKVLLGVVVLLSACATTEPAVEVRIQRVEVPIAVPCKATVPVVPDFGFDKINPDVDIFEKTKTLLSDRKLHLGYETELLAALNSCVK